MIKHRRIMPRVTGDNVSIETDGVKNTIISGKDWALVLPKDMPIQQVIDELTEKHYRLFLDNWKGDKGVPRLKEEIDKRYRDEAHVRFSNILQRSFLYGDILEHLSVNRTKTSATDADSLFTIELKLEFRSSDIDIRMFEAGIERIIGDELPE